MTSTQTFGLALVLTITLGHTTIRVTADDTSSRPVAAETGTVTVDGVDIQGRLVQRGDDLVAEFTAVNTGDEPVQASFNYAVYHTPAMSMMSRMMPMPLQIASENCSITVAASSRAQRQVIVHKGYRAPAPAAKGNDADAEMMIELGTSAEVWSMVVARGTIDDAAMWGAGLPTVADRPVELGQDAVTLATSIDVSSEG